MRTTLGCFVVLSACGGGVDLGVSGSKRLADLDQDEACRVYEGIADYTNESFEISCYAAAQAQAVLASDADFEDQCQTAYDACVESFSGLEEDVDCVDVENNTPAECDTTVSDVETCLEDSLDAVDIFRQAKCNRKLDLDELASIEQDAPASCDALDCGLF